MSPIGKIRKGPFLILPIRTTPPGAPLDPGGRGARGHGAAEYYHLERPVSGAVSMQGVAEGFARIRHYPQAAPEVSRGVRGLTLPKFPHAVIYEVRDTIIRVLASGHHRRRPFHWRGHG